MKHPHPSGRPIRREQRKSRSQYIYPAGTYATPRLRPQAQGGVADAIAYKEQPESEWGTVWGFVDFRRKD